MRHGEDTNDNYPTTKQERAAMKAEFTENVIAKMETAEEQLFEAAEYLRQCPGYEGEVGRMERLGDYIESLRLDMTGE